MHCYVGSEERLIHLMQYAVLLPDIITYYHANRLYCNMFHTIESFEHRHATWVCHWIRARRDRRGRQGRRLKSVGDDRAGPTQQASACCPAELHDPEPSRRSTSTPTRRRCNRANRSAPRRDSDDELYVAVVSNAIHLAADTGRVITSRSFPAGCRTTLWQLRRWCRLVRQAQRSRKPLHEFR